MSSRKAFTEEEIDFIDKNYPAMRPVELAQKLSRTRQSIQNILERIGKRDKTRRRGAPSHIQMDEKFRAAMARARKATEDDRYKERDPEPPKPGDTRPVTFCPEPTRYGNSWMAD